MLARQTVRLARSSAQRRTFALLSSENKVAADQKLFADHARPTHLKRDTDKFVHGALWAGLGLGLLQFVVGEVNMSLGKK